MFAFGHHEELLRDGWAEVLELKENEDEEELASSGSFIDIYSSKSRR